MFPETLRQTISRVLTHLGDPTPIANARMVGGGCINHALRLQTDQRMYMLKWNANPLPDMFLAEARGLELMRATSTIRVPDVLATANATSDHPAYILLEWLEGTINPSASAVQEALGSQLAHMHRATAAAYGLDHHNYLGTTPQQNGWDDDWVVFFRERRLRPQIDLAQRHGLLPPARRNALERVLERLENWLGGVARQPSLIHGDLWGGNLITGPGNLPALIDPAIYYGDREAELAYTQLFGGFHSRFYAAYEQAWPLDPGYPERRDLYNLYHLLNHLNIFGETYGPGVDAVARRYG